MNRLRLEGPRGNWHRVKWRRGEAELSPFPLPPPSPRLPPTPPPPLPQFAIFPVFLFAPSSTREPVHRLEKRQSYGKTKNVVNHGETSTFRIKQGMDRVILLLLCFLSECCFIFFNCLLFLFYFKSNRSSVLIIAISYIHCDKNETTSWKII